MPIVSLPPDATDTGLVPGDFQFIQSVNWNTDWWVTLKDGTNWTLAFNTPAPADGSGQLVYFTTLPAPGPLTPLFVAPDAADSGIISGDFVFIQSLNWNTTWWVTLKDGLHWTIAFGTAAPADASGIIAYVGALPSAGSVTLGDYLDEVRRLLHDATAQIWSDADLITDINRAIRERDLWSGGARVYRPNVPLILGRDLYSLRALFPDLTVLDVLSIWLIYGQTRYRLDNPTFTDLNDRQRIQLSFQNRPTGWTRYGQDQVFIATKPAAVYLTDWDLVPLTTTLVNPSDLDPLTFPYTEPVAYYAAQLACINQRRWDLADHFLGYYERAMRDIEGSRVGEMLTSYATSTGGRRGARA